MVRKRLVPEIDLTYAYVNVNTCEFKDADAFCISANYAYVPSGRAHRHLREREREIETMFVDANSRRNDKTDAKLMIFSLVFLQPTCKNRNDVGKF